MSRTIKFANCRADFYRSISKLTFLGHVFHSLQTLHREPFKYTAGSAFIVS